jgi:hypothetical protein
MDLKHKFRSGKHVGKTVEEVLVIEPGYIDWVKENQPAMLRPSMNQKYQPQPKPEVKQPIKQPPPDNQVVPKTTLEENRDFLNQGPHGKLDQKNTPNE